jgi:geranylgeranyl diphosphate synthase type I
MRRHGVACLVAALATSGSYEVALPAAAAVEMVASFVEIHDDIQGGHPARNGRDAVWWVWGPAQAINAGDGMHALARLVMLDLQNGGVNPEVTFRASQLLDEASLEMCEGRFKDMEAQERIDMSVATYLEMARAKSGSLMAGAMRLGALVGSGGNDEIAEAFGACGAELGIAMQAAGDVSELVPASDGPETEGPLSEEVLNKKKLLPVVHAIQNAGASERRRLGDVYFKRVLEPADVVEVQKLVEELGGREHAIEVSSEHRARAVKAISSTDVTPQGLTAVETFADALMGDPTDLGAG